MSNLLRGLRCGAICAILAVGLSVASPSHALLPGDVILEWMDQGTDPWDVTIPLTDFPTSDQQSELLDAVMMISDLNIAGDMIGTVLEMFMTIFEMMGGAPVPEGSTFQVSFMNRGSSCVAHFAATRDSGNVLHLNLTSVGVQT